MLWFYTSYFYKAALNTPIKRGFLQAKVLGLFEMQSFTGLAEVEVAEWKPWI